MTVTSAKLRLCPCYSGTIFAECCQPYLLGKRLPQTPAQLMRSRYTAFTCQNIDYIMATQAGAAALKFNRDSAERWAAQKNGPRTLYIALDLFHKYLAPY